MANKDAAFGLKPIGKIGQNADNNGLSEYDLSAHKLFEILKNLIL